MIYTRYLCHRLCKPALVITNVNSICSHNYTIYDKKSKEATYYVWKWVRGWPLIPNTFSLFVVVYPTPMTLASGGSPMFLLLVHQPTYLSIWPSSPSFQRGLSTNPEGDSVVRMWVQLKRLCVSCVCVLQRDIVVLYVIWCRLVCWPHIFWRL